MSNSTLTPSRKSAPSEVPSLLNRLTRVALLTPEEELELAERARKGDEEAKQKLVEANMRLVMNIAKHYRNALVPFEDLVQEGAIGLMNAVERYDPSRGYRFSTYATHWIRQAIGRAIDNKAKMVRIPAHVAEQLRRMERERERLRRETGEEPSIEQLAKAMGVSPKKVMHLQQAAQEPLSLDMLIGEEEDTSLGSLIHDQNVRDPEEVMLEVERRKVLDELLQTELTDRERQVIIRRLGYGDQEEQVLQEIGEALKISRERVRQIEAQAMRKLKDAAKRRGLREYLLQ
ncbi:MAG: RNA polymerase sigma factor RpoD/SigA [Armatimonadota bacterium]|nr:RNA polymerase sigma factor RpoD/SigA [bacterium]MCS7310089.1 RNA polymerase sigma factor RpoD/SigA [Armatimonadota bacterium]MDW8104653.1 RNA polymerase sigma factor RpoD/SigA [Armatimonadota bacterium]MDW8289847.1 RNA polymerase sigma factor RpoD/SigA [Armatimonadota bacterium]